MIEIGRMADINLENCACTGSSMPRFIQPAILAILSEGPAHGYVIVRKLGASGLFGDNPPDATGVYRVLKTMEGDGSLVSEWDTSDSGPARKSYTITQRGVKCLVNWRATLLDHQDFVARLSRFVRDALEKI